MAVPAPLVLRTNLLYAYYENQCKYMCACAIIVKTMTFFSENRPYNSLMFRLHVNSLVIPPSANCLQVEIFNESQIQRGCREEKEEKRRLPKFLKYVLHH